MKIRFNLIKLDTPDRNNVLYPKKVIEEALNNLNYGVVKIYDSSNKKDRSRIGEAILKIEDNILVGYADINNDLDFLYVMLESTSQIKNKEYYTEVKHCDIDCVCFSTNSSFYEESNIEILEEESSYIFTEDEMVILKSLPSHFNYIIRDKDGNLYIYAGKPTKEEYGYKFPHPYNKEIYAEANLKIFNHIFKNIRWEDEQPFNFRKHLEIFQK